MIRTVEENVTPCYLEAYKDVFKKSHGKICRRCPIRVKKCSETLHLAISSDFLSVDNILLGTEKEGKEHRQNHQRQHR